MSRPTRTAICKVCEKSFSCRIRPNRGLYCSILCGNRAKAKQLSDRAVQTRPRHICKYCSKEFIHNPWHGQGKYCSLICKTTGSRLTDDQKKERMKMYYDRDVVRKDNCWDWNGIVMATGYGSIPQGRNKIILAHRASWLIHFGEIPKGLFVLHKCDNPPCTNPEHLFIGDQKTNVQDMNKKGRAGGQFKKGMIPHNKKTYRNQLCLF